MRSPMSSSAITKTPCVAGARAQLARERLRVRVVGAGRDDRDVEALRRRGAAAKRSSAARASATRVGTIPHARR